MMEDTMDEILDNNEEMEEQAQAEIDKVLFEVTAGMCPFKNNCSLFLSLFLSFASFFLSFVFSCLLLIFFICFFSCSLSLFILLFNSCWVSPRVEVIVTTKFRRN